jgi:hypothetical protein
MQGTFFTCGVEVYRFKEVVHCVDMGHVRVPRVLHMFVVLEYCGEMAY